MIPVTGVLITLVGGVICAIIAAFIYAYAVRYIPFVYITFFATLAFGAAMGFVVGMLARVGKLRNRPVMLALTAVVALVGLYFAWVFWVKATLNQVPDGERVATSTLITSPAILWEIITVLNENGTWSLKSSEPVHGILLTIVWLIEAGVILGLGMLVSAGTVSDEMFCETCNRWTPSAQQIRRTVPADSAIARQRLEARDFKYIMGLAPDPEGSRAWWSFSYRRCEGCDNLHALSLTQNTIVVDDKGNTSTKTVPIVDKLLITSQEAQAILAATSAPPPPPQPDATAKWRKPPSSEKEPPIPLE
jgi:hypothetical protein